MTITPFLPWAPYNVDAARPFNTLTLSILFGSKSKNLEDPTPLNPPCELVSDWNGIPSTTKRAWLLPFTDEYPRITTFVADPDVPLLDVIATPDAFPESTLATSPSVLCSICSESTSLTA